MLFYNETEQCVTEKERELEIIFFFDENSLKIHINIIQNTSEY